jgi:hypothetical protein
MRHGTTRHHTASGAAPGTVHRTEKYGTAPHGAARRRASTRHGARQQNVAPRNKARHRAASGAIPGTAHGIARHREIRHGTSRRRTAPREYQTPHGTARHRTAPQNTARHLTAPHGAARVLDTAPHGTAKYGTASHGAARKVSVGLLLFLNRKTESRHLTAPREC